MNDDGNKNGIRTVLLALVSAYIIYLGVGILQANARGEEGLPSWAAILFGVFFIISGIAYMIFLLRRYMQAKAEEDAEGTASLSKDAAGEPEAGEAEEEKENENHAVPEDAVTEESAQEPIEDKT